MAAVSIPLITLLLLLLLLLVTQLTVASARPSVIIVGAGMSGISAAKTLSDAGVKDFVILEATDRIGGRMRNAKFAGLNVEIGANWVEGVNGKETNPIWAMANKLGLKTFYSDYDYLSSNTYKQTGGLYQSLEVEEIINTADDVTTSGEKFSRSLVPSGREDISIMTYQRLQNQYTPYSATLIWPPTHTQSDHTQHTVTLQARPYVLDIDLFQV